MGVRKSLLRLLLGQERAAALHSARTTRRLEALSDRQALLRTYLPFFARRGGRILWIGCRDYTAAYPALLEAQGAEVWTTELDPTQARWGREGRHRTGDMLSLAELFSDLSFDAVICNGVFGHGVDSPEAQADGLAAIASVLEPGGFLLLGWNTHRMPDPESLALPWFSAARSGAVLSRTRFADCTHVYDLMCRIPKEPFTRVST